MESTSDRARNGVTGLALGRLTWLDPGGNAARTFNGEAPAPPRCHRPGGPCRATFPRRSPASSGTPAASASSPTPKAVRSRAIVAAALEGLACVKHRGAVAADGQDSRRLPACSRRSPGILRRRHRRRRPLRPRRRPTTRGRGGRAAEEPPGRRLARARDRRQRARRARPPHDAPDPPCGLRAPSGERQPTSVAALPARASASSARRAAPTSRPARSAPSSTRASRLPTPWPTSTPTWPTRPTRPLRHLPPALLDQHAVDLGAGPALPAAVPQRRDQRHRRQRGPHAARAALGTEAAGLGPEEPVPPGARRNDVATPASSTRRSSC